MGRARLVVLLVVLRVATARADDPSDRRLFWTGVALAPPTYLVGVTLHEGSHALAAKLVGGTVDLVHLFPPGIDPRAHKFRFGWTYTHGITSRNKRVFFLAAPKITDALFLSTYAALYFTDALPSRGYGLLALTVGATGFWVDFAKDVVLFSPTNDVVKVFRAWCMTGWRQIPARLVYATVSVGFSYAIIRGYQRTFGDTTSPTSMRDVTLPVLTATF
jgi:hypothetical protein